jgi:uncharacterized protein YndB with AHSA1/START domain
MDNSMIVETTGDRIHIEVVLPVAARQVWTLLTEKQHIATWWGNHVDREARPPGHAAGHVPATRCSRSSVGGMLASISKRGE